MKKTHKKIVGFLGLLTVVAITAVAILMPAPQTQATTTSVTDTITVRVVNNVPNVDILGINNGEVIVTPDQSFTAQWQNVKTLTASLKHTDLSGDVQYYTLDVVDTDFYDGEEEYIIHFVK